MKKHVLGTLAIAAAALLLVQLAPLRADAAPKPLKVFVLAGQSNMDGQRSVNDVAEFKGTVKAIESAPLLHPEIVAIKTAGWLNLERDLEKDPITPEEQAMLARATSNQGFHYYGEGRFFILLGKAFAETMLDLMGAGK